MRDYWPGRSAPKGFSIEKLAKKYREKISGISTNSLNLKDKDSPLNDFDIARELNFSINEINKINKDMHWANRDFREYSKAA